MYMGGVVGEIGREKGGKRRRLKMQSDWKDESNNSVGISRLASSLSPHTAAAPPVTPY